MIEHYLAGKQVFPAAGEKIQITSENAILTKSGSYTLEVKFPLSIYENREFFGDLNRIDTTKNAQTWDVEIINNGITMLIGTATLLNVTESDVSLQYVAGNSQVNFWENADKTYVDEFDFNTTENGKDRVEEWREKQKLIYNIVERYHYERKEMSNENGGRYVIKSGIRLFYYFNNYMVVQRPFIGEKGVFVFCNVYDEDFNWDKSTEAGSEIRVGNGTVYELDYDVRSPDVVYGIGIYANCVQPNLLWIIKQIISKRGYSIGRNDLENLIYIKDMYIASARQTLKLADALPHWTIKEFFEQVENFFNCIIVFREEKKICDIIMRREVMTEEKIRIEEIQDEHEEVIQNEGDTEKNIISSNIRYKDIGKEGAIRCDDETRKKYETVWGDDINDLWRKSQAISETERTWRFYRIKSTGYTFGLTKGGEMLPIDYLCPINRNSENYVDLKIMPARTAVKWYPTGEVRWPWDGNSIWYIANLQTVLTVKNSWGGYERIEGDIVKEVLGQSEGRKRREKEDYMPVFFYNGHKPGGAEYTIWHTNPYSDDDVISIEKNSRGISTPVGDPYTSKYWNTSYGNYRGNYSMALVAGHTEIYHGQVFEGLPKINMEAELQVIFFSIAPPNPRAVFYIHNKKYLCSKIEYEIDENGIIPLMKGYFHEVIED